MRLRPDDPGGASFRRAARAAIVVPAVFAVADLGFDNAVAGLFGALGAFSLLVFADFKAPLPRRAASYAITTVVSAALVAIATLLSPSPVAAGIAMAAVAFVARFVGVYGGAFTAAASPVILAFALAGTIVGDIDDIPARSIGWLVGGAVSTVAALLLWPDFPRSAARQRTARALRRLAGLIDFRFGGGGTTTAAPTDLDDLRFAAATPLSSFGPAAATHAFACLAHETARLTAWIIDDAPAPQAPLLDVSDRLSGALTSTLTASAASLDGAAAHIPLAELEAARRTHADALDAWTQHALRAGDEPERVLDRVQAEHRLRSASMSAFLIGADAAQVAGHPVASTPLDIPREPTDERSSLRQALHVAAAQSGVDSVVVRNSLRTAAGLGLAVLVGGLVGVEHGFWVALAALSVLRSTAMGTGRQAVQALLGTILGFVVAAALVTVVDDRASMLWISLPILVFLAAYTPTAVHFIVGQAAFTVFVVAFFNLVQPSGWQIGLVRVEDIALGVGLAAVVGTIMWPRGARSRLAHALAQTFRAGSDCLAAALTQLLAGGDGGWVETSRSVAIDALARVELSLNDLMHEGAPTESTIDVWVALSLAGGRLRAAADRLDFVAQTVSTAPGCSGAEQVALRDGSATVARFRALADRIELGSGPVPPASDGAARRAATIDCLASTVTTPSLALGARRVVWADDWIHRLDGIADAVEAPTDEAAQAAARPWWR